MDIVERLKTVDISWSQEGEWCAEAADEIERLRDVLQSNSNNTCCDNCQEAALVARAALKEKELL